MHSGSFKTRFVAIFLVAFVCLNAGGAVCVAYCQSALEAVAAAQDHCPLKKKAANHCDPSRADQTETNADAIAAEKVDCCPMTLSFVGAPFEKRSYSFAAAALSVAAVIDLAQPAGSIRSASTPPNAYRGPPLDRRVERIKHRFIRI